MSIHNAATVDNSIGSHAMYIAPNNWGEITQCDNHQHTRSQIDPNEAYPTPIEASLLLSLGQGTQKQVGTS